MLEWLRFAIAALLIAAGLVVMCTAVFGTYKFKYVLNRMHSAAMGDTLGISSILLGLAVISGLNYATLKLIAIVLVLWVTSPVASHLICRLEITTNERLSDEMEDLR